MALVVPDEGEIELLKKLLINTSDSENYLLKLYTNDPTLGNATTLADFVEATFTNYAEKTLVRGASGNCWSTPTTNGTNKAESGATIQSWTCGATGQTIIGYYVIGSSSTKVLWAEKFSSARALVNGDILNLTPAFTLNSAN